MPWLRLDDGFAQHPKIARLARADRWTWLEILLYCARYRTGGVVPASISEVVSRATPPFLNRCFELHLLDMEGASGEDYVVHDWEAYNPKDPTAAARQERYRRRNADRNADRNSDRDEAVTDTVTNVTPPAQAPARVPSPTPTPVVPPAVSSDLSAVRSKTTEPTALPVDKELETSKLLMAIGSDADERTPDVVRALAKRLPPASLVKVRESLSSQEPKDRAAYAVGALQSEFAELAGRHA